MHTQLRRSAFGSHACTPTVDRVAGRCYRHPADLTGTAAVQRFKIIGTGSYLPDNVVTNDDLAKTVDTSDTWIRERTGIRARRYAPEEAATSDLAAEAIRRACVDADMSPADLDAIIIGTCSQDTIFPSTACISRHAEKRRPLFSFALTSRREPMATGVLIMPRIIGAGYG